MIASKTPAKLGPGNRLIGYARVSTDEQDLRMQTDALLKAGVLPENLYTDKRSGATQKRQGLEHALLDCRPGDVLVVWKLDRLSRSLKDLIALSERLSAERIELRSLHEQIDTTNPMSKFFFHLMSSLAEFERSLISWRTSQGMRAARRRGAQFGPRPKLGSAQVRACIRMLQQKKSVKEVAEHFGVSGELVRRKVLAAHGRPIWQPKKRKTGKAGRSTAST